MSLIPSESGHFPDLIGQHHGYRPKARRPPLKRVQSAAPARPASPALPKKPENKGDTVKSQNDVGSKASPKKSADPVELLGKSAPENSISPRRALPIPPQRSVAQMRAKIQTQETVTPRRPTTRPRTPPRGLAVTHSTPAVREKPNELPSLPLPLPNLAAVSDEARHGSSKLVRFIVCELIAIGVLILAAKFDFSHLSAEDLVSVFWRVLASAAAVGTALLPIIFYALPDTLRRNER
jgi:hypothetical protein